MIDLIGRYTVVKPSLERQFEMDAFAALPPGHPIAGFVEFDVTRALEAIDRLQEGGVRVSLFAFVVRSIAVAISEHPDLNLVRHGDKLARFEDVDIAVPVEVETAEGKFPKEVVIRRAHQKSVAEIYAELTAGRTRHGQTGETGEEDRWAHQMVKLVRHLPRFIRLAFIRFVMRSAFRIKERAGTTLVTSVGKFASIPGFQLSLITGPRASSYVVGAVVEKPWAHAGQMTLRKVLSLTIVVDHDLVDGSPAARFAARLQQLIESAEGLG